MTQIYRIHGSPTQNWAQANYCLFDLHGKQEEDEAKNKKGMNGKRLIGNKRLVAKFLNDFRVQGKARRPNQSTGLPGSREKAYAIS
ncbi:MAG: hypothetical protein KC418_15190 [Anaerolineales bacterium]|nr:hypothetical protein [Anaerolineales bacterium]MCB8953229.1 hypothetical protein [Ardenticatenales bacterium]